MQYDRRSVASNLDNIFGSVRPRGLKKTNNYLIDHRAVRVDQFRELAGPGTPPGRVMETRDTF
jgi:hypothetical protein